MSPVSIFSCRRMSALKCSWSGPSRPTPTLPLRISREPACCSFARMPEAKVAVTRARALCEGVTPRERQHIDAIALAVEGAAVEALATVRAHASEYPRDALPLSLALGVFGLLGFSGRRDHHEAQLALLKELAPRWDDDWWFLGYLGWAYIETGDLAAGVPLVERSLAGNQRNAHAAHQRVHGFFEAGDAVGGAAFIEEVLE